MPLPPHSSYYAMPQDEYIQWRYGSPRKAIEQLNADLLPLAQQWLARERRRQAAGLKQPWTYEHMRLQNPENRSNSDLWKCAWHPRTNGEDIAREYPPDWIGDEPVDNYNNYKGFKRADRVTPMKYIEYEWKGPNGATIRQSYRDGWLCSNMTIPHTKSIMEAIDAYWLAISA